jgi:hypothetical protein
VTLPLPFQTGAAGFFNGGISVVSTRQNFQCEYALTGRSE